MDFLLQPEPQQCHVVVSSIFFSLHPFANIGSAVFKRYAIRFAAHKKTHRLAIDYDDLFQIQNNFSVIRLTFKKSPQLGYRLFFDPSTQGENRAPPSRRSLNPEGNRLSPFDRHHNHGCARLCSSQLGTQHEKCNQVPNRISLKTDPKVGIGVTGS
jgi:hypothetical protein